MRPAIDTSFSSSKSRKSSAGEAQSCPPTTFFLTRDPDSEAIDASTSPSNKSHSKDEGSRGSRRRSTIKPTVHERVITKPDSPSPSRDISLPESPRSADKSEAISYEEDAESQAVVSGDEEMEAKDVINSSSLYDSAPQLVMPSIRMPSRRPFTQRGQHLGKFKILVAGGQGCGRTSLIKSIVQLCEDIVHVDPITNQSSLSSTHNEIYASTKPYPKWWSEVDHSRILKRRKSVGDFVLERNICFVDTVGAGKVDTTLAYLEQQFLESINSIRRPGGELGNLLSGRGGSQVDLVLYLTNRDTIAADMDSIQRISQLVTVVPLISKADLLSDEQIAGIKSHFTHHDSILSRLPAFPSDDNYASSSAPYSVSSLNGPDIDNMDASLLMSSEYVQPLMPSELGLLIEQIFDPSVASFVRHVSASRLVAWYGSDPKLTQPPLSPSLRSNAPSTLNSPLSHSGMLVPITSEVSLNTSNSYALAKVVDHTQREEHLAQIRLCKWASELQLSLQRERERYEDIARNERALWLVQRMGEEIREGQIVRVEPAGTAAVTPWGGREKSRIVFPHSTRHEIHDPLGLLQLHDTVRTRGWVMLQVIGSFGVVGGVTIWLARTWGWTASLHQWAQEYGISWFGHDT